MNKMQSPFAQPAEYFTNGGRGYAHPQVFSFPECNVNVNCYFKELTAEQLEKFKKGVEYFYIKNYDPNVQYESLKTYYAYVFEDTEEFRQVGSVEDTFGAGYLFRIAEHPIEQDPLALSKEYFINGNQGYEKYHKVSLFEYNIEVRCYYNTLSKEQLKEIENNISIIFINFFKEFSSAKTNNFLAMFKNLFNKYFNAKNIINELKIFKVHIFNNMEDYNSLIGKISGYDLENMLGINFYRGANKIQNEIFIEDPSELITLKHELAHALTYYVADSQLFRVPKFILEGIALYLEDKNYETEDSVLNNLVNLDFYEIEEVSQLAFQDLVKLGNSQDSEKLALLYRAGYAAVSYLQAKHFGALEQYLMHYRKSKILRSTDLSIPNFERELEAQKAIEPLLLALSQSESMKKWLYDNSEFQFSSEDLLATPLSQGDPLATQPVPPEEPSTIQPSFHFNKVIEAMFAWLNNPYIPFRSCFSRDDSKTQTVSSVSGHQQSDLTLN